MKKTENEVLATRFRAEGGITNDSNTHFAAPAAPTDAQPDLLPPMGIHTDRDMLSYLMQAFDNEMGVCELCGHEEPTKHMDSAHFLREYLAAAQSVRDAAQPTGSRQCGKCKRVSDIVELEKHCPFCQPTIAPGKDKP